MTAATPKPGRGAIRVEIRRRQMGGETVVEEVEWPAGWPIPEPGSIVSGNVLAGWVEHCEFDLPSQSIVIALR